MCFCYNAIRWLSIGQSFTAVSVQLRKKNQVISNLENPSIYFEIFFYDQEVITSITGIPDFPAVTTILRKLK